MVDYIKFSAFRSKVCGSVAHVCCNALDGP
jgi:hypothetical protein